LLLLVNSRRLVELQPPFAVERPSERGGVDKSQAVRQQRDADVEAQGYEMVENRRSADGRSISRATPCLEDSRRWR
jgi:hypothetical protein